jgi:hypothetical protein
MFLKHGPGVDHRHVPSHELGRVIGVIRVNQVFYCVGSKNDIIFDKKIMVKNKNQ